MRSIAMSSLLLLAVVLITTACGGSAVNQENYDKIATGMPRAEVIDILGEPDESGGVGAGGVSLGSATWKDGDRSISITFMGDKVQMKTKQGF